jgi:SagB-type dehydrogenase family enzyme
VSAVPLLRPRQTARWVELVYGSEPGLDDPAEGFHEASKISPSQIARQVEGARRLDSIPELQLSSLRSVKRLGGMVVPLPPAAALETALSEAVERRRSRRTFGAGSIGADSLAAMAHAGYGVTHTLESGPAAPVVPLRSVPSGGALYPLELFLAVLRVDGLEPALYHFDPLAPGLERVRAGIGAEEVAALSTYPEIVRDCAVLFLIAAVFGRTRFKYGLRGYRFALLEAGHLAQNVVLAAAALDLACVPLGGFYDRRTDTFLGLDGVNESALYTIAAGVPDGR